MAEVQTTSWVQCDDCSKWRKIDEQTLDEVGDGAWSCNENPDPAFASCEVPQEPTEDEVKIDPNDVDVNDPDEPEPEPEPEDEYDPADDD